MISLHEKGDKENTHNYLEVLSEATNKKIKHDGKFLQFIKIK